MASRKSVLGGSTLTRPAAGSARRGMTLVETISAQAGEASGHFVEVAPSTIAAHPLNPRDSLGDLTGLTASIKELGVCSPLLLAPIAAFRAANPDLTNRLASGAEWVALAGHRRHAAALDAGVATVPAMVQNGDVSAAAALDTFIAENVHRQDLAPLEEARAYALMADLGRSQRAIAQRCGVGQSHVSKRLALLKLPQGAQDALARDELQIKDALLLADADDEIRDAAWERAQKYEYEGMFSSVRQAATDARRQVLIEEGRQRAEAEEVRWLDPTTRPGSNLSHEQVVTTKKAVTAAKRNGTLVASFDGYSDFAYFDTSITPSSASSSSDRQRAKEAKVRETFVADLVQRKVAPKAVMVSWLCSGVIQRDPTADALKRAFRWIGELTSPTASEAYAWGKAIDASSNEDTRIWVAWAIELAAIESYVRASWGSYQPHHVRYFDWLVEQGYTLQEQEKERLNAAAARSDSTESPETETD